MFTVDLAGFSKYALAIARDKTLMEEALGELRPLFDLAEQSCRRFAGYSEICGDQVRLRQAIASALGRPVDKLAFLSLSGRSHPVAASWSVLADLNKAPNTRLLAGLGFSNWECLHTKLWISLWDSLDGGIWAALSASGQPEVSRMRLYAGLTANLRESIFSFVGFAALGDAAGMESFRPLVRLFSRTIPLGEKDDEPGTWFVVVA